MNDSQAKSVGENWIEMYDSLIDSVAEASGSVESFRFGLIMNWTVSDLFNALATNRIRFICLDKEEKTVKEP